LLYKLLLSSKHTIMSSFYEDASLVMIPSGYKTSKVYSAKPTDGAGDLSFTRSNDTATRVGPDGLIEKVRTNLLLQSNSFDTTWTAQNATLTSGQSGYDGSNDAWKVEAATTSTTRLYQSSSIAANTLITISLYAKVGNVDFVKFNLFTSGANSIATFDLTDGTVSASNAIDTAWEEVGSGWVRISATFINVDIITEPRIEVRSDSNTATCDAGSFVYIQDAQIEVGDIATDYIATTSAAVSVGPVANVPRLDYLGSSCPRLLLEPQRQNVLLNSENASSQPTAGTVTVSSNSSISPDGYQNADTITADSSSYLRPTVTTGVGTAIAWSLFLKNVNSAESILMVRTSSTAIQVNVAWTGAVPSATVVGGTGGVKVVNYGNDWYRFEITTTSADNSTYFRVYPSNSTSASVISWGSQVELNARYSTSYIPTLGAAVTRGADLASKTGISSLIGQTEGTIYVEVNAAVLSQMPISSEHRITMVSDDTNNNRILVDFIVTSGGIRRIGVNVISGNVSQAVLTFNTAVDKIYKIATAYNTNDFTLFVDGVERATDVSGVTFSGTTLSRLDVGQDRSGTLQQSNPIAQALLFKTRLENDDLAALTAL
jgi:hypothetical protein